MKDDAELPPHGRLACSDCFQRGQLVQQIGNWKMRQDPGSWGARRPRYMVLGFSKGATQVDIYANGAFDDVAFGGARTRRNLTNILRRVGLLSSAETVDQRINAQETEFHFTSLVRCSLARRVDNHADDDGGEVYVTSGPLITKSFVEIPDVIKRCTDRFLSRLPSSLKLILILGVTDAYVRRMREIMKRLHPQGFHELDAVSYRNDNILWVHLTHPSKGNGTLNAWLDGNPETDASARKRELAIAALRKFGFLKNADEEVR